jgi:hypothetical protein
MSESQYHISKVPLAEAKADIDISLVLLAEVIADDVIMLGLFDHFKLFLDVLAHRNGYLLDSHWALILVIPLVHLSAVAAAPYVSVRYDSKVSNLSGLKDRVLIFLRERQAILEDLVLCELGNFWEFRRSLLRCFLELLLLDWVLRWWVI